MVIINFKASKRGCGDNAVALAKQIDIVNNRISDFEIAVALQPQDIYRVRRATKLKIYAQHVDPIYYGNHSGSICPEAIKDAGATGTLLNHPEKKISKKEIEATIKISKEIGLEVALFASNVIEGIQLSTYHPNYIVIEYERLIGSSLSLMETCPEIVKEALLHINNQVLFGAGIKTSRDTFEIINNGGAGVIVSSVVVNSDNPVAALSTLLGKNDLIHAE